jgi:glycosyltransferase involved in cell wall biosynthesis
VSVVSLQRGESLNVPRGSAVVCIEAAQAGDAPAACVDSVLAHTPDAVPIVVCDNRAAALAAAAPADVVLVAPRTIVTAGWLEGLRQAALSDSTVATASAITSDAAAGLGIDEAAARVRERSLRIRPRLELPQPGCVYVRRASIELVGAPEDLSSFSERCVQAGLSHVLADDVLVAGPRGTPAADAGPAARASGAARRALRGMSVTVDARILSRPITGTEVHVLELIAALARTEQLNLKAIVPDRPSDDAARALGALPTVELIRYDQAGGRADIVHRPYQLSDPGELTFLAASGERLVLTHQDLISYHNPSYFPDRQGWRGYRKLTQMALATADRVVFFSAHARDEALAEELVDPARASVVHLGVDHPLTGSRPAPVAPAGAAGIDATAEVILCLGTDYAHKNRVFALRLLDQLRRRKGWGGYLVFAGPSVAHGSSRAEEAELRARLSESVIDVGAVSEDEKDWLLTRSRLVVYPTIHEGFGLVPFEAAQHGTPCLWAPGTSLNELLPDDTAGIVPWDAAASADRALELLSDDHARGLQVAAVVESARQLTWDLTAQRLLAVYESVCDAPATNPGAHRLSEDAMRLVGPGGALPADVHRPLLALATHPRLGAPVFGALRAGYRASYKLRRLSRGQSRT